MQKYFRKNLNALLLLAMATLAFSACKSDDDDSGYTVPSTYTFDNVNYSGQTARLDMLAEMKGIMNEGNQGTAVDAQALKNMYRNENTPFADADLNTTTKQLKSKTFEPDQDLFEAYMDSLAAASNSGVAGSKGQAGVVTSNDNSKQYLFAANGYEYTQMIEKGLMGATFMYQALSVYLSADKIGPAVDNETVTPGEGTAMEHHWDEAFGYWGVPVDFPGNTSGARFWGSYTNGRDGLLGTSQTLMDAFLKGRAAISNGDMATLNEQVIVVRNTWELVSAATAIHYLNEAKDNIGDDALRNHTLSEAIAFLNNLKYTPLETRDITTAQWQTVRDYIGENLYEVTIADLNNARDELSSIYGLDNVKDQL